VFKNKFEQPIGEWILKRREEWDIQIPRMTERIVRVLRGRVQETPRSAGPTHFLQETGYQPNQKKQRKEEIRRILFSTHPSVCSLYIDIVFLRTVNKERIRLRQIGLMPNFSNIIFQHPVAFEITHVCSLPSLMQLCFSWFL
jgi:hypothetical protein